MYNTYMYNQRKYNWFVTVLKRIINVAVTFIKGVINPVTFIKAQIDIIFKGKRGECQ